MLADLLSDGPLPVEEALHFSVALADALRQIHDQGSVYGILDPARVSVNGGGVELLPVASPAAISPYSAPEQLEGKQDDPRSDIFALGAVLYEMLTGRKAFPNGSRAEAPPFDTVPPALTRLLGKCLEVRPERRLQRVQLALIQLKLLEAVTGWTRRGPVTQPDLKQMQPRHPLYPLLKLEAPTPPSQGICPKCRASDVRHSRPKGSLEDALEEFGARFNRCYRCYHRFMRLGFLTLKRPG